jgi:hypothetical protein
MSDRTTTARGTRTNVQKAAAGWCRPGAPVMATSAAFGATTAPDRRLLRRTSPKASSGVGRPGGDHKSGAHSRHGHPSGEPDIH